LKVKVEGSTWLLPVTVSASSRSGPNSNTKVSRMLRVSSGLAGWVVAMPETSKVPVCSSSSSSSSSSSEDDVRPQCKATITRAHPLAEVQVLVCSSGSVSGSGSAFPGYPGLATVTL
jgi:hypothetical protein